MPLSTPPAKPLPTGDSISEGTVAAILKTPGSAVNTDDIVAQIETDKVTIDVRAPASGSVLEIKVGAAPLRPPPFGLHAPLAAEQRASILRPAGGEGRRREGRTGRGDLLRGRWRSRRCE